MQRRYPGRRKTHMRDFKRGGRLHNVPDWHCEGCGIKHSGFRDSTRLSDGKLYCDHALYQRQQQLSANQQD